MASDKPTIRIGYVPEHYLTPLHLAARALSSDSDPPVQLSLIPFPSGTGHMITSLRENEIDLAIGLTEGWIAGLVGMQQQQQQRQEKTATTTATSSGGAVDGGYKVVGHWVDTPLRWAVVTGRNREDVKTVEDLKGRRVGVSRMGSGSHIMSFVLAQKQGWTPDSLTPIVLGPFQSLRNGVIGGEREDQQQAAEPAAEFFMWEHFTTKPYFHATTPTPGSATVSTSTSSSTSSTKPTEAKHVSPAPPLKKIGEIFTPWPSWLIVASTQTFPDPDRDETLQTLFQLFDRGIREFEKDSVQVVHLLGTGELGCRYSEDDAMEWLKDVKFADATRGVDPKVVEGVVNILKVAGVIDVELGNEEAIERVIGVRR